VALSSAALTLKVLSDYFAAFPAAAAVTRSNPSTGVLPHSPPAELISAICGGLVSAMLSTPIYDAYEGVVGSTAVAPAVVPAFNPGVVSTTVTSFHLSLGWTGVYAPVWTSVMITGVFANITALAQIAFPPLVGAGPGAGVVSPAVNPALGAALTSATSAAILSELAATGYFAIGDVPGNAPTPQISALATALAVAYGTIVGSVMAATVYTGSGTTSPLLLTNTGKFV
jgi:hypothetical protein